MQEWLNIAEQQRTGLARAVATSWQLPDTIADAISYDGPPGGSALNELVQHADHVAAELDAGRQPQARDPAELRQLDELMAGLPAALEAFAPPTPKPTTRPAPPTQQLIEKPQRRATWWAATPGAAAELKCSTLAPTGIEVDSSRPFQEGSLVRLAVGDAQPSFEPWVSVVLCLPTGSRFRVELELFSPTRETREHWRALYDAP